MTGRRCEQCEGCYSHVESEHCGVAAKNCNKRHIPVLLTCARCKEIRYCSQKCQREQWVEHKASCQTHVMIATRLKLLGPRIEQTFKAFKKFTQNISAYLELPAISALELYKDKTRINTHVFLVKIKGRETVLSRTKKHVKGMITFTVESAECRTMSEMHDFFTLRAGPFAPLTTPEFTERALAHRPGLLRIFILETSGILPVPLDGYTLPTDISNWPDNYHKMHDRHWFRHLLKSIGQPLKPNPNQVEPSSDDELAIGNVFHTIFDEDSSIPPARPSTPTIEKD